MNKKINKTEKRSQPLRSEQFISVLSWAPVLLRSGNTAVFGYFGLWGAAGVSLAAFLFGFGSQGYAYRLQHQGDLLQAGC